MKLTTSRLWLAAGGLLLAAGLGWAFWPRAIAVTVAPVGRGALVVTVDEEGRTRIRQRYVVSAPLAGRLLRVELRPGDAVEAERTLVAVIEPADPELLDPRARALAEARVNAATAALARTEPSRSRAGSAHAYAAEDLARARRLFADGGLSHQELDAAERREAETAAELSMAEYEGRIARFELEAAQSVLAVAGSAGSGRGLEIRAPVSGRVLRVFQESAVAVAAGARLVEIGDPADLEVVIEALSTDAVRIAPGARVAVEHWGGDAPLPARIRLVEPAGFTKVSALGVEEQRVNVLADFTGPAADRRALGDGFRVEVRIVVAEASDVLTVPLGALFRAEQGWAVYTAEAGRAQVRPVEIGRRNSRAAEVVRGLTAGEKVVVHPGDQVRAGVRLRPRSRRVKFRPKRGNCRREFRGGFG